MEPTPTLIEMLENNTDRLLEIKDNLAAKPGREEFERHEASDVERFQSVEKRLSDLERKAAYAAGALAVLELILNGDKIGEALRWMSSAL